MAIMTLPTWLGGTKKAAPPPPKEKTNVNVEIAANEIIERKKKQKEALDMSK